VTEGDAGQALRYAACFGLLSYFIFFDSNLDNNICYKCSRLKLIR
jgi:hypothetical protein